MNHWASSGSEHVKCTFYSFDSPQGSRRVAPWRCEYKPKQRKPQRCRASRQTPDPFCESVGKIPGHKVSMLRVTTCHARSYTLSKFSSHASWHGWAALHAGSWQRSWQAPNPLPELRPSKLLVALLSIAAPRLRIAGKCMPTTGSSCSWTIAGTKLEPMAFDVLTRSRANFCIRILESPSANLHASQAVGSRAGFASMPESCFQ